VAGPQQRFDRRNLPPAALDRHVRLEFGPPSCSPFPLALVGWLEAGTVSGFRDQTVADLEHLPGPDHDMRSFAAVLGHFSDDDFRAAAKFPASNAERVLSDLLAICCPRSPAFKPLDVG
jgi:hypothetical protein